MRRRLAAQGTSKPKTKPKAEPKPEEEIHPLVVDPRAGSKWLAEPLRRHFGVPVVVREIEFGDVAWCGNGPGGEISIGVELKTLSDLLNAIRTGRLQNFQVPGMCESYDRSYLLIQGVWTAGRAGQLMEFTRFGQWREVMQGGRSLPYSYLDNALTSVCECAGFQWKRTGSDTETLFAIVGWWKFWGRKWAEHRFVGGDVYAPVKGPVALVKPNVCWRMAQQLPGVGAEKGRAVAQFFKQDPWAMCGATVEEWKRALGIKGKKSALAENLVKICKPQAWMREVQKKKGRMVK